MRFVLPLLVLCYSTITCGQQLIEFSDQLHDLVSYTDVFQAENGNWIFVGSFNDEDGASAGPRIIKRSSTGELIWTTYSGITTSVERISAGLLYSVSSTGCDFSFPYSLMVVHSTSGELLFTKEYRSNDYGNPNLNFIARGTLDRLALYGNTYLYITSLSGDSLTSRTLPATNFRSATWTAQNNLLLAGGNTLLLMDALGNTIIQGQAAGPVIDLLPLTDATLVLLSDRIEVYDDELQLMATASLESVAGTPKEFMHRDGQIMVRTSSHFVGLNEDLDVVGDVPIDIIPGQTIAGAVLFDSLIMTCGTFRTNNRRSGIMRSYDLTGQNAAHTDDVAIELLSLDGFSAYGRANLTVRVSNNGQDTLNSVFLTYQPVPWPWNCGILGTSLQLNDLGVAPGTSRDVPFNELYLLYDTPPATGPWDLEICVIAMSPNRHMDRDTTNNISCREFTGGDIATGWGSNVDRTGTSIFPNPAMDVATIRSTMISGPFKVSIMDALGRIVLERGMNTDERGAAPMDVSKLGPGQYAVMIEQADRSRTVHSLIIE